MTQTSDLSGLTSEYSAHNYAPLPVVVAEAAGAWVTDVAGRRYLDMLAGYSALNFGHRHPRLVAAATRQIGRVTLVSRAFDHDQFGPFCAELADLCGMEMVLPMNTGVEAVETAIKVARKWGYEVRGVPRDEALIVVFDGNFHGRTTTVVSFSSDPDAREGFGPYAPGFVSVPYGDLAALASVFDDLAARIVAVLVEPIQGEAGVVVPPPGFLAGVRAMCTSASALMIADEIQSGLGRVGTTFACEAEDVVPDAYLLGKALGGGIVPVSAMVSARGVLGVLRPGQHGSTFGGNPLACAVAREVIAMLRTGEYQARSASLGAAFHERLASLPSSVVSGVSGRGLWAGVTFRTRSGRAVCEQLATLGVLAKETHGATIRLAPPLVITEEDLAWGLDRFADAGLDSQLELARLAVGAKVGRNLSDLQRDCSAMLIFLPPSEAKAYPAPAPPVDLSSLVLPELAPTRTGLLKGLARLARSRAEAALGTLGLSEGQAGELAHNRVLRSAPAGMAAEVYAGVLYDALDLPGLQRRGVTTSDVLIFSGLWGVLRPSDRIPHYRCAAGVKLPAAGSVSAAWRKALRVPLAAHAGDRLVVDLRSGAYAGLWAPGANAVTVRVLHERDDGGMVRRAVVSHFNKATKGRLTRALLESGQQPRKPDEFADLARALGYTVEPAPASRNPDAPTALDIVVREL